MIMDTDVNTNMPKATKILSWKIYKHTRQALFNYAIHVLYQIFTKFAWRAPQVVEVNKTVTLNKVRDMNEFEGVTPEFNEDKLQI